MKRLLDLDPSDCRWPMSMSVDEKPEDIMFCGAERQIGCPYCTEHENRAYGRGGSPKPFILQDRRAA